MKKTFNNSYGFSLVELMITVAISGLIMLAIFSAYIAQEHSYTAQEQVVEMQQNIRSAIDLLEREARMAGYDPLTAGATITTIAAGQFSFQQDVAGAGIADDEGDGVLDDDNEIIDIGFSLAADGDRNGIPDADANGDGVPDVAAIGRQVGGAGGYQPITENIQAIEFQYLDSAGAVTIVPADVRAIRISILARASQADLEYTNSTTYTPASGIDWDLNAGAGNAPNDHFRRRLLITTVQCRNMGLE